jgi:hypothetical protein
LNVKPFEVHPSPDQANDANQYQGIKKLVEKLKAGAYSIKTYNKEKDEDTYISFTPEPFHFMFLPVGLHRITAFTAFTAKKSAAIHFSHSTFK